LDDLSGVAPRATNTELRTILGSFLFGEDDVFKPIGVLSGGERNRYALARMLMVPSNFMLLDEPTNHLDMRAKDVLLTSLEEFEGTVVFVSHDRYFIDKLATRVFEIGEGKVEIYPGNYEDYLWRKQGGAARQTAAIQNELAREEPSDRAGEQIKTAATPTNGDAPSADPADSKAKRLNPIKRKQMQDRLREIEEEITKTEAAIALSETQLQSFVSAAETQRQTQELAARKTDLRGLMNEWEELSEALA
ncbi:MAG TPA: ATP-binding cassette domain-containing protein, partial [Terriglobales bacterium]|nr:ATP-binding cassette domain-containing protein [Terriglobales bacterium]